jgi:hypothetical protein
LGGETAHDIRGLTQSPFTPALSSGFFAEILFVQ